LFVGREVKIQQHYHHLSVMPKARIEKVAPRAKVLRKSTGNKGKTKEPDLEKNASQKKKIEGMNKE
jgi:hypothetical protein